MIAPMFDRDGRHLEQHGTCVRLQSRFPNLNPGSEQLVRVYTRRDPRTHEGRAVVLLDVALEPFSFTGHLDTNAARVLGETLLLAAQQAEAVQAEVNAKAARTKAEAP